MKNYLLLMGLCLMANLTNAQQGVTQKMQKVSLEDMLPKTAKYYIKGESAEIPYAKIDSVIKSWGGRFVNSNSNENGVQKIYLEKPDESMLKRQRQMMEQATALMGKAAPLFELTDVNGKKYSLKDLQGKVVVLNFWFVACVPCIQEMPELNKLTDQYKNNKDVVFLAIGLDRAAEVKEFLKTQQFNYNLLTEGKKVADEYGVAAFPTSMVINRTGVISYIQPGGSNIGEMLHKQIEKQL